MISCVAYAGGINQRTLQKILCCCCYSLSYGLIYDFREKLGTTSGILHLLVGMAGYVLFTTIGLECLVVFYYNFSICRALSRALPAVGQY